jgi:hypothetical protein
MQDKDFAVFLCENVNLDSCKSLFCPSDVFARKIGERYQSIDVVLDKDFHHF